MRVRLAIYGCHLLGDSQPRRSRSLPVGCTAVSQSDPAIEPTEPEELPVCPTCKGEGGSGDDRCAIVICPDCEGSGVWRPGSPCPCGSGFRAERLDPATAFRHVVGCPQAGDA